MKPRSPSSENPAHELQPDQNSDSVIDSDKWSQSSMSLMIDAESEKEENAHENHSENENIEIPNFDESDEEVVVEQIVPLE